MATRSRPDHTQSAFNRFVARAIRTRRAAQVEKQNAPFSTRLDVYNAKETAARCWADQRLAFAKFLHPRLGSQSTAFHELHELQLLRLICENNRQRKRSDFGRWDLFGLMLLQHKEA